MVWFFLASMRPRSDAFRFENMAKKNKGKAAASSDAAEQPTIEADPATSLTAEEAAPAQTTARDELEAALKEIASLKQELAAAHEEIASLKATKGTSATATTPAPPASTEHIEKLQARDL